MTRELARSKMAKPESDNSRSALPNASQKNSEKNKRVQQEIEFDPVEVRSADEGAQVRRRPAEAKGGLQEADIEPDT